MVMARTGSVAPRKSAANCSGDGWLVVGWGLPRRNLAKKSDRGRSVARRLSVPKFSVNGATGASFDSPGRGSTPPSLTTSNVGAVAGVDVAGASDPMGTSSNPDGPRGGWRAITPLTPCYSAMVGENRAGYLGELGSLVRSVGAKRWAPRGRRLAVDALRLAVPRAEALSTRAIG